VNVEEIAEEESLKTALQKLKVSRKFSIHPTAVIYPRVEIEDDVEIGPYCVIGGPPEHREFYSGKESKGVRIESGSRIFSHVTIDSGTKETTVIGKRSALFQGCHVAHDCILGPDVTIGGQASLAGHTLVMEGAVVSGHSCTFQRVVIGAFSFVGGMSFVTRSIPPGEKWVGYNPRLVGKNDVGLARAGLTYEEVLERYFDEFGRLQGKA
jgi:UDP-N-acetylglucosamine acyltransferase